jgi:hypothetical protein
VTFRLVGWNCRGKRIRLSQAHLKLSSLKTLIATSIHATKQWIKRFGVVWQDNVENTVQERRKKVTSCLVITREKRFPQRNRSYQFYFGSGGGGGNVMGLSFARSLQIRRWNGYCRYNNYWGNWTSRREREREREKFLKCTKNVLVIRWIFSFQTCAMWRYENNECSSWRQFFSCTKRPEIIQVQHRPGIDVGVIYSNSWL